MTERGLLFDAIAEEYEAIRPTYPGSLVDSACEGIPEGGRVLEVGCGTGKLTRDLAGRGFRLEAVEPGPGMVAVARRAVGGAPVSFHVGRFEDVELPEAAYDAVFSATAFHGVDPAAGWAKVARLLRRGGTFALLVHVAGNTNPVDTAIREAWQQVRPEVWPQRSSEELLVGAEERRADISAVWSWLSNRDLEAPEAARLFADVRIESEAREIDETADEVLAHVRTSSGFLELAPGQRDWLEGRFREIIDAAGGYRNTIYAVLARASRAHH